MAASHGASLPQTVSITARDFPLEAPDTLAAGAVTLRLVKTHGPLPAWSPLANGGVSSFAVELEPAHYALICFLPDAKDGKPHLAHGMMQEVEIGRAVAA